MDIIREHPCKENDKKKTCKILTIKGLKTKQNQPKKVLKTIRLLESCKKKQGGKQNVNVESCQDLQEGG